MKMHKTLMATLLSAGLLASAGAQAAGWCESGKPVKFAGLNWEKIGRASCRERVEISVVAG